MKHKKQMVVIFRTVLLFTVLIVYSGSLFAADRLELESTSIIGTKELPKILYIVPWKTTKLGSLNSIDDDGSFDSAMEPLDRFVFRREIKYQKMLQVESEGVSP